MQGFVNPSNSSFALTLEGCSPATRFLGEASNLHVFMAFTHFISLSPSKLERVLLDAKQCVDFTHIFP